MKHITVGTLLLPLILIMMRSSIIIGSAKPVPINEYIILNQENLVCFLLI